MHFVLPYKSRRARAHRIEPPERLAGMGPGGHKETHQNKGLIEGFRSHLVSSKTVGIEPSSD